MLKLKKKVEEKKAEEGVDLTDSGAVRLEEGKEEEVSSAGGLKLLGIGGREVKKDGGKKTKKTTPGEIRIQKDIAELDAGDVASVEFPNPKDLTSFNVFVRPDQGFWKGARYHFTFNIPADYPHTPPIVSLDC
jgi:ubiquitin-conjugating enzyme E2 M